METTNPSLCDDCGDEDYIDIELLCCCSPQTTEFEFQMFTTTTTSPADHLFFNGKLLTLHPSAAAAATESSDLNPEDYSEWSNEPNTKITWSNKLKLIKISILGINLKSSRAYLKSFFKNPFPTITSNTEKEQAIDINVPRRSFSSAIKCLSSSSSSSSSFSLNSNELRRSSSAAEIEGSIEAAIAHCKKSQRL